MSCGGFSLCNPAYWADRACNFSALACGSVVSSRFEA